MTSSAIASRSIMRRGARLAALLSLCYGSTAFAAIGLNHGFSPSTVVAGQASTLTVNLINQNTSAATETALAIPLAGLTVTDIETTCAPGTAALDGDNLQLTNGTIPAGPGGNCTVTAQVSSSVAGNFSSNIPVGSASSSQGSNTEASSIALQVNALAPITGSKAFAPTTVRGGGTSTVTITLNNRNSVPLTGTSLTDNLPATLRVAATPDFETTCSGTPAALPDNTGITLTDGTIPANGSCTVSFDVTPVDSTTYRAANATNTITQGQVTADHGASNIAPFSATVAVRTGAQIVKAFRDDPVNHGVPSSFTLQVINLNATELTGITFTDTVPSSIEPTGVTSTCNGTSAHTSTTVSLTGASLAANSNCTLTVTFTPNNTTGDYLTASNVAANFGAPLSFNGVVPSISGDSITVNPGGPGPGVSATKSFNGVQHLNDATAVRTNTVEMVVTLHNASGEAARIVSFRDDLSLMGTGFTVGGPASTTCGGLVNADMGSSLVEKTDGTVPAGSTCTITVPVRIASDTPIGWHTNRIGGTQTGDQNRLTTNIGGADHTWVGVHWARINVRDALTVAKSFAPTSISSAQTTSEMTIRLNRAANVTDLTGIAFTDTFPAAPFVLEAQEVISNSCGGTVDLGTPGQLSLSGGTIDAGGGAANSCELVVRVGAPAGANGSITNTIAAGAVTTAEDVSNRLAASAAITASSASLQLSKEFASTNLLGLGNTTPLRLIISNTEGAPSQTGVTLTDNLPFGMVVADPANASLTGAGCTLTGAIEATPGESTITLTGADVNAGATCTLEVTVQGDAVGNLINTIPAGGLRSATGLSNTGVAQATVTVVGQADLGVTITNNRHGVTPGGETTYVVTVTNHGDTDVAGATLVNTAPPGITYGNWTCEPAAGSSAVCPADSGSGDLSELISLAEGDSLVFTIQATVDPDLSEPVTNTATVTLPGSVEDVNPSNNTATDIDPVILPGSAAVPVPTIGAMALSLLALMLFATAHYARRRRTL